MPAEDPLLRFVPVREALSCRAGRLRLKVQPYTLIHLRVAGG